ncbi:MAG TPA: TlpA disulfide reductase family protein [Patescibacteria group bacterium]|nr:TlpA disulfide reductase family protein [Patescibacteria group bacterium]
MAPERPEFQHRPERHGLVGPFSGRQLLAVLGIVVAVAVILVAATRPLGTSGGVALGDPRATAYLLGSPTTGLTPGSLAPELAGTRADGTPWALTDVNGKPIRLADLRGKGVWINFWASWCAPCQAETPVLRDVYDTYKDRGLELIGISVQETNPADVGAYAAKYGLDYTIAADLSADAWRLYRGYGLPTHVFIGPDGRIRTYTAGPLTAAQAAAQVEAILPPGPGASPAPGASTSP